MRTGLSPVTERLAFPVPTEKAIDVGVPLHTRRLEETRGIDRKVVFLVVRRVGVPLIGSCSQTGEREDRRKVMELEMQMKDWTEVTLSEMNEAEGGILPILVAAGIYGGLALGAIACVYLSKHSL
jgi:hypothetical protein